MPVEPDQVTKYPIERPEDLDRDADRMQWNALYAKQLETGIKELEQRIEDAMTVLEDPLDHGLHLLTSILKHGSRIHRVGNEWLGDEWVYK